MNTAIRKRVLTLIAKPREVWEIAILASTITKPVTPQAVLSALINLERDDLARQVGKTWERVEADQPMRHKPAALPANSVFTWRA